MSTRLQGNVFVTGTLAANGFTLPDASVSNSKVAAAANIEATKLEQQYAIAYAQESSATAAAETKVVHAAYGSTGAAVAIQAGMIDPNTGDAEVEVDLLLNGTTILTGPITLTSAQSAGETVAGTLVGDPSYSAGDRLEISVTTTPGSGSLGDGVFAGVIVRERAQ